MSPLTPEQRRLWAQEQEAWQNLEGMRQLARGRPVGGAMAGALNPDAATVSWAKRQKPAVHEAWRLAYVAARNGGVPMGRNDHPTGRWGR